LHNDYAVDRGSIARYEARIAVLILSAGVGRGHQSAAEGLRDELLRVAPDVRVSVQNALVVS
jgi:hypothetical protein